MDHVDIETAGEREMIYHSLDQTSIKAGADLDVAVAVAFVEEDSRGSSSIDSEDSKFSQSRQEHFLVQANLVRKHSQYLRTHRLFLQAHPEPISLTLGLSKASGRFSKVASMAAWRCPPLSWCVFKHPTQVQVLGLQAFPTWKQVQ
jgi:hypothetical protein